MRAVLEAAHYAAVRHAGQFRKGERAEPYVNHVLDVARRVAAARPDDETLILAALLHDIVEDTEGTEAEIERLFGPAVAALVMEVTDDKALEKDERKRLQVEHASGLSDAAKRLKLADKAANVTAVALTPPAGWPHERKTQYVDWAEAVAAGLRGVDDDLERGFDEAVALARKTFGESR